MKIAYIEELFKLVPHGGIAVWSKRLTDYLATAGHEVRIFSYSDGIDNPLPAFLNVFPNLREIFIYPVMGKKAVQKLDQQFDLVQCVSPHTLVASKPNIPAVISVHYLISRQAVMLGKYLPKQYKVFFNFFSYHLFRHFEARGFQHADCITVSRQAYKDYLIQRMKVPAEKIRIVKYGIDHEFFRPATTRANDKRMALFVGRGSLPKGFDTLVKAASKIKGQVLAVASQIPKSLQQQISRLPNFEVRTGLSHEELRELYQKATVYVMPSLTEGSPITTLEAMASGLPVVCTAEGSGEYIEDGINGFVVPFKDENQIADRVNYLFEHPELCREFGTFNRQKVETELT
ncbi:MAG: glycosyltransferase family 4 protein, partial [candidate division KSB1 bacterium]|nr:glycosyltransferase family 4 protein [candidate division KSB1 bacterium]